MKILKALISLSATILIVYALKNPITLTEPSIDDPAKINETVIPPIGSFLCPFGGFWQNAESSHVFQSRSIQIPEFDGKVKIVFDERLVPHIFADNLEDAIFAQGYVTAMNRLWQMDMITRLSGGRLAEVLGENLLSNDQLQRRRGLLYGAENAVKSWEKSPEEFKFIESYSAGVNAYTKSLKPAGYPLEFKLLNYQPEVWSPLKSALVKKYMDLTLCFGEDDIEATNALRVLERELFDKLYPEYNPKQTPVIPSGTPWNFKPEAINKSQIQQTGVGVIQHNVYEKERELVGSNNWAVAGLKTLSGNPILCNDPHLQLSLPSVWFEIQIHTPEANIYGVSIPGIPGVLIGFNEHIAWGETNVGHDVLDWYQITWTDAEKTSYQFDGGIRKVSPVIEKFKVRGKDELVKDTVKWTLWGPIVYESNQDPYQDLAMRWLAHDAPNPKDISTFLGLNTGKNLEDYENALRNYDFPAQNFAFASNQGDIAITVNGKFPIKRKEQGRFVQDGSMSSNAWQGWVAKERIPKIKNPALGFVASANQHSTDPSYPYYYNSREFDDFRARYLVTRLSQMEKFTVEDMMKLQNSNFSIQASEGLPPLLQNIDTTKLNGLQAEVYKKLSAWDFNFEAQKVEPVIFEKWWNKFYEMTFDEVLVWKDSLPMLTPENWRLIDLATNQPTDMIFDKKDTPGIETIREIANASFIETINDMADDLVNPQFNWASYKKTSIMHLTRIPAFSRLNLDVGGYRQALNAISETHGPSWRMVVELGKEVKGWGIFPGGQSGNPGSPFYDTGILKWSKGEYNELFFMKSSNDNRKKTLFTLEIN